MGQDKASVLFRGKPLIERVLDAVRPLFSRVVIVGRQSEELHYSRDARPGVGLAEPFCIPDEEPGKGPLGGLYSALRWAGGRAVFLVGCDMPFVNGALVRDVVQRMRNGGGAVDAVVPDAVVADVAGRLQPLHAVYSPSCLPLVEQRLRAGKLSLHGLLAELSIVKVSEDEVRRIDPDLRSLVSLNRPEEVSRWQ